MRIIIRWQSNFSSMILGQKWFVKLLKYPRLTTLLNQTGQVSAPVHFSSSAFAPLLHLRALLLDLATRVRHHLQFELKAPSLSLRSYPFIRTQRFRPSMSVRWRIEGVDEAYPYASERLGVKRGWRSDGSGDSFGERWVVFSEASISD